MKLSYSYWVLFFACLAVLSALAVFCLRGQSNLSCLLNHGKTVNAYVTAVDHPSKGGTLNFSYIVNGTAFSGTDNLSKSHSNYWASPGDEIIATYCASDPNVATTDLQYLRDLQPWKYVLFLFDLVGTTVILIFSYRKEKFGKTKAFLFKDY